MEKIILKVILLVAESIWKIKAFFLQKMENSWIMLLKM